MYRIHYSPTTSFNRLKVIHFGRIQSRVHGQSDATIDAHCRIEDPIEISECHWTLWHLIDQKTQCMSLQIQQYANCAACGDATLDTTLVYGIVLEPRTLSIDVHGEGLLIFACNWYEL